MASRLLPVYLRGLHPERLHDLLRDDLDRHEHRKVWLYGIGIIQSRQARKVNGGTRIYPWSKELPTHPPYTQTPYDNYTILKI